MLHNFIRGNDKVPGAWATINGQVVTLYSSTYLGDKQDLKGDRIDVEGASTPDGNFVCSEGMVFTGADGKRLLVRLVQVGKKTIPASDFLKASDGGETLELTKEENIIANKLRGLWSSILSLEKVADGTDFFESGAASMDVTRLIEGINRICAVPLEAEHVYMNTSFGY